MITHSDPIIAPRKDDPETNIFRAECLCFVCSLYGRSSGGAGRSGSCKPLISLGGARRRSSRRSKGGAAELRLQVVDPIRLYVAELDRRSGGARPYKRGGLLRCLPAAPLSFKDSEILSASIVCPGRGRHHGIRFGDRLKHQHSVSSGRAGLPHPRISVRVP
jgi:hypothetical protein